MTDLQNVHTVYFVNGGVYTNVRGVYVWPQGWITVYRTQNRNEGEIFPAHMIEKIEFGRGGK